MHSTYREYLHLILNDETPQAQGEGQVQDTGRATEELGNVVPRCSVSPALGLYRKTAKDGNKKVKVGIRSDTHCFI